MLRKVLGVCSMFLVWSFSQDPNPAVMVDPDIGHCNIPTPYVKNSSLSDTDAEKHPEDKSPTSPFTINLSPSTKTACNFNVL